MEKETQAPARLRARIGRPTEVHCSQNHDSGKDPGPNPRTYKVICIRRNFPFGGPEPWYKTGVCLRMIQDLGGWSSMAALQRYLEVSEEKQVEKVEAIWSLP